MPRLTTTVATTEVDAVNTLLSTIGEAPFADQSQLDASTSNDVITSIEALKNAIREVCSVPWKFNTEKEYKLTRHASSPITWAADGVSIGVFTVPAGLLAFQPSLRADQQGSSYTDAIIAPSRQFATIGTLIFRDRQTGRDGFPVADRTFLYIDPMWLVDFANMPETAKKFVIAHAGRTWQQGILGSEVIRSFTADDERLALRNLKRDQGQEDDHNILSNMDVSKALGGRPRGPSGYSNLRNGQLGIL